MAKQMVGFVAGHKGQYFSIECAGAPAHLRLLFLVRGQMLGAFVGDVVRLEYQTTSRSGLWNVVEIVRRLRVELNGFAPIEAFARAEAHARTVAARLPIDHQGLLAFNYTEDGQPVLTNDGAIVVKVERVPA